MLAVALVGTNFEWSAQTALANISAAPMDWPGRRDADADSDRHDRQTDRHSDRDPGSGDAPARTTLHRQPRA
jgi:hypothetical protein